MNDNNINFEGFDPEVIKFLTRLKQNNRREWFNERKEFYEKEIKLKAQALIAELQYIFANEGLNYMADIKKSLFRIYRDVRFSKNKEPYKTHIGLFFPYVADGTWRKPIEATGIYLHIEPELSFIAGGLHMPQSQQLKNLRVKIANDWEDYYDIIKNKKFTKEFPDWYSGESLKRVPAGFPKDHPAAEILKQKSFTASCNISNDIIYSRKLIDELIKKAKILAPFLEFLNEGTSGNLGL